MASHRGGRQGSVRGGGGGGLQGGSGTKMVEYRRWPEKICRIVEFVFSHCGQFGVKVRGGGGLPLPAPMVYSHTNVSLGPGRRVGGIRVFRVQYQMPGLAKVEAPSGSTSQLQSIAVTATVWPRGPDPARTTNGSNPSNPSAMCCVRVVMGIKSPSV